MKAVDLQTLETDYRTLIESQYTLSLATRADNGDADISYAPYLHIENGFYIFVSELAQHTGNMLSSRQASVMFIQPEGDAANLFARQRLVLNCKVAEIDRSNTLYSQVLDAMRDRFGEVVNVLRSLSDFHLLVLIPQQGQYVAGFGKAFSVDMGSGALLPRNK